MKKNDIDCILRPLVKEQLSPNASERADISEIYQKIKDILGEECILMGSYARFTSIKPVKDIDILYRLPLDTPLLYSPSILLQHIKELLESEWKDKSGKIFFTLQSHSLKVEFSNKHFTVDIVPAITLEQRNEFGDPLFFVPEIAYFSHSNRKNYYRQILDSNIPMSWKCSDPLGYISRTTLLNQSNSDFRKSIKIIKTWNTYCKKNLWNDKGFKSFHLECFLFNIFRKNPSLSLIESLFEFFTTFKTQINIPSVIDRADSNQYIDEYLNKFSEQDKERFREQIDVALLCIEQIGLANDEENVRSFFFNLCYPSKTNCRDSSSEKFLFDFNIQSFVDPKIRLNGCCDVQDLNGRKYSIDGKIRHTLLKSASLKFYCVCPEGYKSYWKVKNSLTSPVIRGEITRNQTKHYPEHTKYTGHHFVRCYIVKNNICEAFRHFNIDIE